MGPHLAVAAAELDPEPELEPGLVLELVPELVLELVDYFADYQAGQVEIAGQAAADWMARSVGSDFAAATDLEQEWFLESRGRSVGSVALKVALVVIVVAVAAGLPEDLA